MTTHLSKKRTQFLVASKNREAQEMRSTPFLPFVLFCFCPRVGNTGSPFYVFCLPSIPIPSWLFLPQLSDYGINPAHTFYCLQLLELRPLGTGPSGTLGRIQGASCIFSTNSSANYVQGSLLDCQINQSRCLNSRSLELKSCLKILQDVGLGNGLKNRKEPQDPCEEAKTD